jgi:hypothetical protein
MTIGVVASWGRMVAMSRNDTVRFALNEGDSHGNQNRPAEAKHGHHHHKQRDRLGSVWRHSLGHWL